MYSKFVGETSAYSEISESNQIGQVSAYYIFTKSKIIIYLNSNLFKDFFKSLQFC